MLFLLTSKSIVNKLYILEANDMDFLPELFSKSETKNLYVTGGQTLKQISRPIIYSPIVSVNPSSLLSNKSSTSRQVAVALQHLASQYSLKSQRQMTPLRKEITT
jgi:hypothetical protein